MSLRKNGYFKGCRNISLSVRNFVRYIIGFMDIYSKQIFERVGNFASGQYGLKYSEL